MRTQRQQEKIRNSYRVDVDNYNSARLRVRVKSLDQMQKFQFVSRYTLLHFRFPEQLGCSLLLRRDDPSEIIAC